METMTKDQCENLMINGFADAKAAMAFVDKLRSIPKEELKEKSLEDLMILLPEQFHAVVLQKLQQMGGAVKKSTIEVKGFRKYDQKGYDIHYGMLKDIVLDFMETIIESPEMHEAEIEKMQADIAAQTAAINNIEFDHTREIRAEKILKIKALLTDPKIKRSAKNRLEEELAYVESVLDYKIIQKYLDDSKYKTLIKPYITGDMDLSKVYQKRMLDALYICKSSKKKFPRLDQFPAVVLTAIFNSDPKMISTVQYFFLGYINLLIGRKMEDHIYIYIIETAFEWESLLNGKLSEEEITLMRNSIIAIAAEVEKTMEEFKLVATV